MGSCLLREELVSLGDELDGKGENEDCVLAKELGLGTDREMLIGWEMLIFWEEGDADAAA